MQTQIKTIIDALSDVILGKEQEITLALCALLARGHLLLEDLPGMGKTTLSHALSQVLGLEYKRIQFTSDLLPSDILGSNVFNAKEHSFQFHPGPIFSQVVLADEINRASPKTQSALLEAMEENQVSIDRERYPLSSPFFVIATQNPYHQHGTYALPESQLDRFFMRLSLGYPPLDAEKRMLMSNTNTAKPPISPLLNAEQLIDLQNKVSNVLVAPIIGDYILALVTFTRTHNVCPQPLSPRATLAIAQGARAWAFMHGRDHTLPEDVQAVFAAICEHRVNTQHDQASQNVCEQILKQVSVPV